MTGRVVDGGVSGGVVGLSDADLDRIEVQAHLWAKNRDHVPLRPDRVLGLVGEVRRLRGQVEQWRTTVERAADEGAGICECGVAFLDGAEVFGAAKADRDRLADAIRTAYGTLVEFTDYLGRCEAHPLGTNKADLLALLSGNGHPEESVWRAIEALQDTLDQEDNRG